MNIILYFFSLAYAPVFLFGAIKLRQLEQNIARTILVWGFTLLTVIFISNVARYFEVVIITYNPWHDLHHQHGFHQLFEPWERWAYWGMSIVRWSGTFLVGLGFFLEAKNLLKRIMSHEPVFHDLR